MTHQRYTPVIRKLVAVTLGILILGASSLPTSVMASQQMIHLFVPPSAKTKLVQLLGKLGKAVGKKVAKWSIKCGKNRCLVKFVADIADVVKGVRDNFPGIGVPNAQFYYDSNSKQFVPMYGISRQEWDILVERAQKPSINGANCYRFYNNVGGPAYWCNSSPHAKIFVGPIF